MKQENNNEKQVDKVNQLFILQDYAKELLFNSTTKRQEENSRNFLDRINEELKMLYIPTPIENV